MRHQPRFNFPQGVYVILIFFLFSSLCAPFASASPVAVRYREGLIRGFLVLTTMDGTVIAHGDLSQVVHDDQVTTRLIYHFKDGSLQDETTVYSERKVFRLISYHLVQKGPAFKSPTEVLVTASTGEVTIHSTDDKGKEKDSNEHLELPADLANGMVPTLLKNLPPGKPLLELAMVVATPKPRIVKLEITPEDTDSFSFGSATLKAVRYAIKINLGGVAGVVAPIVGKQPPDNHIWILGGDAPAIVKSESLSYEGGPLWRTELSSPSWGREAASDAKEGSPSKH